jgi:hypothetical protein
MDLTNFQRGFRLTASLLCGVVYGLISRFVFGFLTQIDADSSKPAFERTPLLDGTMNAAFIFITPFAVGALAVLLAPFELRRKMIFVVSTSALAVLLVLAVYVVFQIELLLCGAMLLPAFWVMGIVGGVVVYGLETLFVSRNGLGAGKRVMATIIPLLPMLVLPFERLMPLTTSVETVTDSIEINAPPGRVWDNVVRVREIQPGAGLRRGCAQARSCRAGSRRSGRVAARCL